MRIPKSQIEFERMFTTEKQSLKFLISKSSSLEHARIIFEAIICPIIWMNILLSTIDENQIAGDSYFKGYLNNE
jgi:hypothetical protein